MAEQRRADESIPVVAVVAAAEAGETAAWAAELENQGYRVERVSDPASAERMIEGTPPAVLVIQPTVPADPSFARLRRAARSRAIPILDIIPDSHRASGPGDPILQADEVVFVSRTGVELPTRIVRLHHRSQAEKSGAASASAPLADPHFASMIVHDLRTPLNVIGLSLRMVNQTVSNGDPDLEEDLRFIDENLKQIERMLAQLSDYCRLFDLDTAPFASEFSPQQLVSELAERRAARGGGKTVPVQLEVDDSCPEEASLDQPRVVMAIQHALANAAAAAGDGPIVVTLRGARDRWIIEVTTRRPAPPSVASQSLRPRAFERLCGTVADRRGLELAIVARISELFNGSARFQVHEDRSTSIIMDWPTRLDSKEPPRQPSPLVKSAGA